MDNNGHVFPQDEPVREPVVFTWREWLALGMSIALAALWFYVFGLNNLQEYRGAPGLGATACVFALFAAVFIYLGRRVVLSAESVLLTLAALLLALSFTLFGNLSLRLTNYFLCLGAGAMAIFALAGKSRYPWRNWRVLPDTVALSFMALFSKIGAPFRAIGSLRRGNRQVLTGVIIGLVIAVPVLAVVIPLLIDADAVFGSLFSRLGDWFDRANAGQLIWHVIRAAVLALLICSALYTLSLPKREPHENPLAVEKRSFTAPCLTVVVLLDILYALFVSIQLAYLFGGAESAAMEGGYAEYARNGFFQLVAVAAINLAASLVCALAASRAAAPAGKTALRAAGYALIALTAVILVSAVWRMSLYISVYGLSLLRAITLFGMAFIAVCLVGAGVKLAKPDFNFFALFFAVGVAGWLVFNYINIDARIADWNVDAYLDGRVEQVDIYYLSNLSPDVLPALERLVESVGGDFPVKANPDIELGGPHSLDGAINALRARAGDFRDWRDWDMSRQRGKQ